MAGLARRILGRSISMRVPLILLMFLLTLIPLAIQERFLGDFFYESQVEQNMIDAQNRCLILANEMMSTDYLNNAVLNQAPALDAELSATAELFDGRIVVIDSGYRIIRDTFDLAEGRTNIVEEVLKTFGGESQSYFNRGRQYFYVTQPIYERAAESRESLAAAQGTGTKRANGVLLMTVSTGKFARTRERIAQMKGSFSLVLLLALAAVDFLAVYLLLMPIRRLIGQLNVVADGNLDQNIREDTYLETEQIAESVSTTIGTLRTVDRSRQEFVSNVSHELKTPITSIRVLADSLMSMDNPPPELYREFMEDISREIDREAKIIDDLLTLVRMDRSSPNLDIRPVSINEMISQILKRLRPIAKERNIELVFESAREVTADVDEVKLSLAITNLVENGIKYNREEGYVRVSLDADHKFFYLKVSDNGIGIPEEFQSHVCERFYRVDKARSRETGGSGLGLSITKNIVLLHQGAIRLKSTEGEGTSFTVRIPLTYIP